MQLCIIQKHCLITRISIITNVHCDIRSCSLEWQGRCVFGKSPANSHAEQPLSFKLSHGFPEFWQTCWATTSNYVTTTSFHTIFFSLFTIHPKSDSTHIVSATGRLLLQAQVTNKLIDITRTFRRMKYTAAIFRNSDSISQASYSVITQSSRLILFRTLIVICIVGIDTKYKKKKHCVERMRKFLMLKPLVHTL